MLPKKYHFLYTVGLLPRTVTAFLSIYGTKEILGPNNNPVIMGWAKILKIKNYVADSIAWCGLAMAWIVTQAGYEITGKDKSGFDALKDNPLWARFWLFFGIKTDIPMLGDVCIFSREGGGGHVGLYIAEDITHYHIGGGNTSDNTIITRIAKKRFLGARIPPYKNRPAESRKRYFLDAEGAISTNEA